MATKIRLAALLIAMVLAGAAWTSDASAARRACYCDSWCIDSGSGYYCTAFGPRVACYLGPFCLSITGCCELTEQDPGPCGNCF